MVSNISQYKLCHLRWGKTIPKICNSEVLNHSNVCSVIAISRAVTNSKYVSCRISDPDPIIY